MTPQAGTDIVSVARIAALIDEHGPTFLTRWFTPAEITYCTGKAWPAQHFAARLAAKEAVAKALRARGDQPLPWLDIEITNDEHGAPSVQLSGRTLESATRDGAGPIAVSLSHCDEYATAVALVELTPRTSST